MGYSPWGCKELDTMEQLSTAHHCIFPLCFAPLDNYANTIWFEGFFIVAPYFRILVFSSVQFSRSVVSDSLRPHESQHIRPPCSPSPGVHSD